MNRKIVRLGPSTLVVSIPSKWVKKQGLEAGDEIKIEEGIEALLIRKEKTKEKKIVLDFTQTDFLLKRILAAQYLKGYDDIEIILDSLEKSRKLQERVDALMGMEVIEQKKDRLIIKQVNQEKEESVETIIRRVFYIIHSIGKEILSAIKNKETDLRYLEDMERKVNRFTEYCLRILNKYGYPEIKKTSVMYLVVFLLEQLADDYKRLIKRIRRNRIKFSQEYIGLYEQILGLYNCLQDNYLKFSLENTIGLAKKRDTIISEINKKVDKDKKKDEILILRDYEAITETIIKINTELLNL